MRKSILITLMAVIAIACLSGCGDDENLVPYFTRTQADPACGVAPLEIQFLAFATGGDLTDDPTGGNTYIDIDWDFGDDTTGFGSVIYHVFEEPGDYDVVIVARDKDGDASAPDTLRVTVRDNFMNLVAAPDTVVTADDPMTFRVLAELCNFDSVSSSYSRFTYKWEMDDIAGTVLSDRFPSHTYTAADIGTHTVRVRVEDLQTSYVTQDSVTVEVTAAVGK